MRFKGIMPALVTPLDEKENVKTEVLARLMRDLIAQGADGFYVGGATGEGLALRPVERERLTEASVAIGRAAGLPCIIQIASTDLSTAVQLAKHAEAQGAAAISATAPVFFSYSADDVWAYYQKLASAVHIPVMVYYNPAAKFPMDAQFGKRLFEIDNVTSIKWTSSDFYQMMLLKELTNGEMDIINGCDEMLLMGLCAGADGGIGTTYNYQLPYVKGVYDSFLAGDLKQAMAYQKKVALLVSASFRQEPIIPAAKAILSCMGYDVGHATFPMKRYTAEEKQAIYAAVRPYLP